MSIRSIELLKDNMDEKPFSGSLREYLKILTGAEKMVYMNLFNPPHPGEILKLDYLEPLEISVTAAAIGLGIARKNLSAIINAKAGVSPDMAIRLSDAFGTTPEFWLTLQSNFDLSKARNSGKTTKVERFYRKAISSI